MEADGAWTLFDALREPDRGFTDIVHVSANGSVSLQSNLANAMASAEFGLRMDAVDRSKDWVPLQLVGYLQHNDIPIPSDGWLLSAGTWP